MLFRACELRGGHRALPGLLLWENQYNLIAHWDAGTVRPVPPAMAILTIVLSVKKLEMITVDIKNQVGEFIYLLRIGIASLYTIFYISTSVMSAIEVEENEGVLANRG